MTDNHLDELLIEAQQKIVEVVGEWVRKQVIIIKTYESDTNEFCNKSLVTESFMALLDNFEIEYLTHTATGLPSDEYNYLSDSMNLIGKTIFAQFIYDFNFTKFSQYELQKNIEFANSVFTWIKNHEHPEENLF